jgi:hypothetical protein
MLDSMDIQNDDIISVLITLLLLAIWFITLEIFNYPLISILILWVGMITLSVIYYFIYKNKKRDMKLFKIRFFVSAIPLYPVLAYYVYCLIAGIGLPNNLKYLPFFIIFTLLFLNALVVYIYGNRNK